MSSVGAGRERCRPANGLRPREVHALRQHRDCRAFERAHQGWLLQQLGQVAVQRGVPADDGFQRQAVDLRIVGSRGEVVQPVPGSVDPVGSYGLVPRDAGVPLSARPNRQLTCARQGSSLPAGWVLALMTLEAAPTPCSRTGFHISSISCVGRRERHDDQVARVRRVVRSPLWMRRCAGCWQRRGSAPCRRS